MRKSRTLVTVLVVVGCLAMFASPVAAQGGSDHCGEDDADDIVDKISNHLKENACRNSEALNLADGVELVGGGGGTGAFQCKDCAFG